MSRFKSFEEFTNDKNVLRFGIISIKRIPRWQGISLSLFIKYVPFFKRSKVVARRYLRKHSPAYLLVSSLKRVKSISNNRLKDITIKDSDFEWTVETKKSPRHLAQGI